MKKQLEASYDVPILHCCTALFYHKKFIPWKYVENMYVPANPENRMVSFHVPLSLFISDKAIFLNCKTVIVI